MSPIRPEKPEDFGIGNPGATLRRLLNDYIRPGLAVSISKTTPFSDRFAIAAFGHPWDEIKPELWVWRGLADVPRESDQCPWA